MTILLEGASGTGKEMAARALHAEGSRRDGLFVPVNCGAIPAGLIESELFGHEKGVFTGATSSKKGRFEQAHQGTLFLDEIGELRLDLQVRLLRVLEERVVQHIGSTSSVEIDVRVVAASNRDLKADVAQGRFREDLYFRLAVFPIRLPPLHERRSDTMLLARVFLERYAKRYDRRIRGLTLEASAALEAYPWPGSVRELENVLERAMLLEDGPVLSRNSLPRELVPAAEAHLDRVRVVEISGPAAAPQPTPVTARALPSMLSMPTGPRAADEIVPLDELELLPGFNKREIPGVISELSIQFMGRWHLALPRGCRCTAEEATVEVP